MSGSLHQKESATFRMLAASLVAAMLMFCGSVAALAQDDSAGTVPTESEDGSLETITVTGTQAIAANKTETDLTEIPQSISVISAQEIRDRTVMDLQDIYRYSAGVAPAQSIDSRGDFINVRGFEAAQYLDGLKRMPDFIYGARLETYTLQRAEVLRGPSSVLYGAGGPGGILNGVSKKPEFDFGGEAGVVIGSDQRLQFQADITGPLSDSFAGRFVALGRDGETQWGTPDDRLVINPSLTWAPGEDTEVTVIALYQDDSNGSLGYLPMNKSILAPNESQRIPFDFYQGEPGFNGMDTTWVSGTVLLTHRFTPAITFRSATRYADMDTDYKEIYADLSDGVSPYAGPEETLLTREFYVNREQSGVTNTDNSLLIQFSNGAFDHNVLLGIDYTWFDQSKDEGFSCDGFEGLFGCFAGGSPPPIDVFDPQYGADIDYGYTNSLEYESTQLGLYVQEQLTYDGWIHLLLGARHDQATSERNGIDELDQDAWSYRGGIIADVGEGFSPYFSYSESFLPVPGGDFFGNPFEPRTARQYEAGVKWEPRAGWLFTANLFDIEEENYISQDPTNLQNFVQGGSVGSEGYELEAFIRVPGDMSFMLSYSHTEAEVLTSSQFLVAGSRIAGIPEDVASAWLTRTFETDGGWIIRAGGGARYVGDKIDTTQTFRTPAVTLIDGMFSASHRSWLVSVSASNLFDKEYYATCGLSSNPYGYCVAAKDRTLVGTVTWQFR